MREILTVQRLREAVSYDPETGIFIRLEGTSNVIKAGDIAGWPDRNGHLRFGLDGKTYAAHRLAWLYVYGVWPSGIIDHKDGVRDNNRINNLRDATNCVNQQNQRTPHKNGTSGFLGVTFHKNRNKFQAQIGTKHGHKYLGVYPTAELAHQAYLEAKRQLHEGNLL